jgi:hypothetical protein
VGIVLLLYKLLGWFLPRPQVCGTEGRGFESRQSPLLAFCPPFSLAPRFPLGGRAGWPLNAPPAFIATGRRDTLASGVSSPEASPASASAHNSLAICSMVSSPHKPRALLATILGISLEDLEYADRVLGVLVDDDLSLSVVEQAFVERRQRIGRLAGRIGPEDHAWMYRKLDRAKKVVVEECRLRPVTPSGAGTAIDPALRPLCIPPPPGGRTAAGPPPLQPAYALSPTAGSAQPAYGNTAQPAYGSTAQPPFVQPAPSAPRHFGPSPVENFVYLVGVLTIVVAGVVLMANFLPKPINEIDSNEIDSKDQATDQSISVIPPIPVKHAAKLVLESLEKMRVGFFDEATRLAAEAQHLDPANQTAKALPFLAAYARHYEQLADAAFDGLPRGSEVDLGKRYGLAEFVDRDGDSWTFICHGSHRKFTTAELKTMPGVRFRITERWAHDLGTPADQLTLGAVHLVKRLKAHGNMTKDSQDHPCEECLEAAKARWSRVAESPDASPEEKEAALMLLTLSRESA